ncbi:MAG: CapA family protein [bacterium]
MTLLAVGDIMMHQEQLDSAYDKGTGVYDFSNYFLNINPYLKGGYIVYANLETPVAGSALKYSGYPKFNAPTELLAELKNNYFTHVSLANNHALDRGEKGLVNTIKNVEDADLVGIGARVFTNAGTMTAPSLVSSSSSSFASTSQATALNPSNYQITEKNGLKIGFLAYTYDTNGMTLPKGKKGELSYIDKNQIAKDILDLKNQKVDAIVMALHFGIEYKLEETASQRDLAQFACDNGADIILGDHPHVLEPIVYLNATSTGQNPIDRKCLVIYSLGNFISSMPNLYTDLGGILKVDISKTETFGVDGAVVSSSLSLNPDFLATWVKRGTNKDGSKYYTVLPLDADKIPDDIEVTSAELKRLEKYRDFVGTKIKAGMTL